MQKSWQFGLWILAGVLLLGDVLNAVTNALLLITPTVTYIGTSFVVLIAVALQVVLKHNGLPWRYAQGRPLMLRGLEPQAVCFVLGIVLVLWYPRAKDLYEEMGGGGDCHRPKGRQSSSRNWSD
jgi:hypothetical protein